MHEVKGAVEFPGFNKNVDVGINYFENWHYCIVSRLGLVLNLTKQRRSDFLLRLLIMLFL